MEVLSIGASVLVVRPYADQVRERVYGLMSEAGCEMESAEVVPSGTPDAEALTRVRGSRAGVLLVPFHGHRDPSGKAVDGVHFIKALSVTEGGELRRRVVMPYSAFAAAAVELARVDPAIEGAVFFLNTSELDAPALVGRLRAYIHASSRDERGH